MKRSQFTISICVVCLAMTARTQSTAGGQAAGTTSAGQTGAGASGQAGGLSPKSTTPTTGAERNAGGNANGNALPPGLQNREQLPESLGSATNIPVDLSGALSNSITASNQFGFATNPIAMSNRFGMNSNGFGGTNFFGGRSNRFGTNLFGGRSNRFGTNLFGGRTNRFGSSNDFGFRSNRFGFTNDFGSRSNRFRTNQIGFTNRLDFSNEIAISNSFDLTNQLGLGAEDVGGVGVVPAAVAAGGGGAVVPGAAPNQPNAVALPPTGNPGADNRIYATPGLSNQTGVALQDMSVTEADRTLLQKLRQLIVPRLEAMGAAGAAVHFWVRDGLVTMVGTVQSPEIKSEAERMVQQIPGLTSVDNRLFVGNVDPNASTIDQALLLRVRETVLPQVTSGSKTPVDFTARNGVVTVVGTVPTSEDAARVAKLVQQVPGVAQVKNRLLISSGSSGVNESGAAPASTETQSSQVSTNLTPTGPSNNTTEPPSSQNQDQSSAGSSTGEQPAPQTPPAKP